MQTSNNQEWLEAEGGRRVVLTAMTQPMTVKQISKRARIDPDTCSHILGKITVRDMAICLNPNARSARVYAVTQIGREYQEYLQPNLYEGREPLPDADWEVYAWLCFRHRRAIIGILTEPMQPSEIKRKLRFKMPELRISANNVRDVIRLFLNKGLVRKVFVRKKAHARYELTELGYLYRNLLLRAEASR
jgi:hypothetical protein